MYLICLVNSQDNFTEWSCELMGSSSSWYVAALTTLVTIGIVIVEMF